MSMENLVTEKLQTKIIISKMKTHNRNEIFKSTIDYFNGDELATNTWINKTSVSSARRAATAFTINSFGYSCCGTTGSVSNITEQYN